MTNKIKIIVAILIILAIGIAIFGIVTSNKSENNTNEKRDEISEMMNYMDDTDKKDIQTNEVEVNNNISNENVESNENKIDNEVKNNNAVVGKEEQESNSENTEFDNKQKAIELAKKEWAISVNSYNFQVSDVKSDGTYNVTVISNDSNRTTVAIYNVNVKTETVKDITE